MRKFCLSYEDFSSAVFSIYSGRIITNYLHLESLLSFILSVYESDHRDKNLQTSAKGCFISVIIPTFQTDHFFDECLDTLIQQDFPSDRLEIIIVLNGDKSPFWDYLTQLLKTCPIPCKLIFTKLKECPTREI